MTITLEDWIEYRNNATKILKANTQYATSKAVEYAIDKHIPKKPNIDIGYDMEGNAWNNWRCPNCRKTYLLDDEEYNYCPDCGQAIDWGRR